ncbi:MAG: hypothetical protein ACKE9I_01735 [Methylophagaceae bacterium]
MSVITARIGDEWERRLEIWLNLQIEKSYFVCKAIEDLENIY